MTLHDLLISTGYPATELAKRIDMPKGTFNNKLKGNNGAYFTGPEQVRILEELERISKEMLNFTKTI